MNAEKSDYLKYWKIVKRYMMIKNNLSSSHLDLLLFLYSEKYFGIDTFEKYEALISWDSNRISNLQKEGWITKFRDYDKKLNQKALYTLTRKAQTMIRSIYDILERKELMDERKMKGDIPEKYKREFLNRKYLEFIEQINEETKRLQHLSPE
jgi:hypothetical protein